MNPTKRMIGVATLALALLHTGPVPAANAAAHQVPEPPRPTAVVPARTVTLISGDRVTLLDPAAGQIRVAPGTGRASITFVTRRIAGHLHVVPADAVPLLRADRLDYRLFDVTELLGAGYDRPDSQLSLLVTSGSGGSAAARTALAISGGQPGTELPALGVFSCGRRATRSPRCGTA